MNEEHEQSIIPIGAETIEDARERIAFNLWRAKRRARRKSLLEYRRVYMRAYRKAHPPTEEQKKRLQESRKVWFLNNRDRRNVWQRDYLRRKKHEKEVKETAEGLIRMKELSGERIDNEISIMGS
mgnify:CR=1 FL=1